MLPCELMVIQELTYFICSVSWPLVLFLLFSLLELEGAIWPYAALLIQPWEAIALDQSGVPTVTLGKVSCRRTLVHN